MVHWFMPSSKAFGAGKEDPLTLHAAQLFRLSRSEKAFRPEGVSILRWKNSANKIRVALDDGACAWHGVVGEKLTAKNFSVDHAHPSDVRLSNPGESSSCIRTSCVRLRPS
jgi:hypothetical protein